MREPIAYAFVDGGYLLPEYRNAMLTVYGKPGELDFARMMGEMGVEKMFFYDALETPESIGRRPEDGRPQAQRSREESLRLHEQIRASDGCHVRLGNAERRSSKRGLEQKEVDILLAVEALLHASQKNMTHAVLVAGDSDFKPLVNALLQLGIYVTVYASRKNDRLSEHADRRKGMWLSTLMKWSTEDWDEGNANVIVEGGIEDDSVLIETGVAKDGKALKLYQHGRGFAVYAGEEDPWGGDVFHVCRKDNVLRGYAAYLFGEIAWTPATDDQMA